MQKKSFFVSLFFKRLLKKKTETKKIQRDTKKKVFFQKKG